MTRQEIASEIRANFDAWYVRNFLDAKAGRIGGISYSRAGALDDAKAGASARARFIWYSSAYDRGLLDHTEPLKPDEARFLVSNPLVAFQLALGITDLRGLRCYRRGLTAQVNRLQRRSYRARYYDRDNERRRRLAAERRKITRRTTLNPCPTPEQFLAAFERRGESAEAKVRFGGMVHDLECYVDNCLKYDENGEICGRNGGIKAWIAVNLPQLNGRYKTIMRYKAFAKRLRQAAEIPDPVPTSAIYDGLPETGPVRGELDVAATQGGGGGTRDAVGEYYAFNSHDWKKAALLKSLAEARRRLDGCGGVFAELDRAVDEWQETRPGEGHAVGCVSGRAGHAPFREDGRSIRTEPSAGLVITTDIPASKPERKPR